MQELQSAPSYPVKQVQESLLHALFCLWWMNNRPRLATVPWLLHLHAGKQIFVTIFLFYCALITNLFDDLYTVTMGKIKQSVFTFWTFFSNNVIGFTFTWAIWITGHRVWSHCVTLTFWNYVEISKNNFVWYNYFNIISLFLY